MKVKIRILKTESALKKMVAAFIARDIAGELQGKILLAQIDKKDGYAFIEPGQGISQYFLPKGSWVKAKTTRK